MEHELGGNVNDAPSRHKGYQDLSVKLAVNEYGKVEAVHMNGLPFSFENARLLYRAIYYSCHREDDMKSGILETIMVMSMYILLHKAIAL